MSLLALAGLLGVCALVQWVALTLFPPLPAAGTPSLRAYGIYSWLVILSGIAALGWFASLLAEAFDGRIDLDAAIAAAVLGGFPAALAKALMDWPVLGWLAPLLLLWSLLLWWRLLGFALRIQSGRAAHLFAVLMGALLVMIAVGWQLRDLLDAAPAVRMGRLWLV